jgi:hypothetical protein
MIYLLPINSAEHFSGFVTDGEQKGPVGIQLLAEMAEQL